MKGALIRVLFLLFATGVFGDADKAETVSVIEGDSVTLHTDVTEIQSSDVIEWRLNVNRIAKISGDSIRTEGPSRDRLKLDKQTGDLKITNIKTTDSGPYKLKITTTSATGSLEKIFTVSGVSGVDEVKSVSLIVGDSVTLNSGTIIQRDDVIEWRFGDLNSLIAENNRKTGDYSTSDGSDGRFRDRLQLDYLTGSLTIRNTRTEHAGFYEAGIRKSSSGHTIHKSYSVTASGEMQSALSVMEGDSVLLHTGLTEIQTDDVMQWMFEDTVIAEINKAQQRFLTFDGPDGRYRGRLKLDHQTGSLNITHTRYTDSGVYELKIISRRFTINKRITVTVTGEMQSVSVMEGHSVLLHTGLTKIQTDDVIQWMFGDTVLAEIIKAEQLFLTFDGPDERYRDRLKLDHQTGSLTITNTRYTDSGVYELKISSSRFIINKRITVTVTGLSTGAIAAICVLLVCVTAAAAGIYYRWKISKLKPWVYKWGIQSVMEGETITLTPDEEYKDDKLLWIFRGSCIAERKSAAHSFTVHDDVLDGRFRGRLKPDPHTGYLNITNTRNTDTGVYELMIIRSEESSIKRFSVSVFDQTDMRPVPVKEGGSVTLETDVDDIQKDEQIQWKLGYTLLAKVKRGTKKISPSADKIFQGRLELNHKTGSLTIKKIRPTDAGIYMLYKIEEGNLKTKLFRVKVSDPTNNRNSPEEVPLMGVHADSRL